MAKYSYSIVAPVRWETDSIVEWLVYHRSLGFQHVYLYCNDDDATELFAVLPAFLQRPDPFVTFVHYPFQGLQWDMYLHWFRTFAHETDWAAFIDADEFLTLPGCDDIHRFMSGFPGDCDAVHFHWIYYGTNGFLTRPGGSVLGQYTRRAPTVAFETKTIVRARRIDPDALRPQHLPFWHLWDRMHKSDIKCYTSLKDDASDCYDRERYAAERGEEIKATAFIAHFPLRSEADFDRRLARGVGGQFSGQAMWAKAMQTGEARGYLDHTNATEDGYLKSYWERLVGCAADTALIPPPPGPNLARGRPCLQSSVGPWSTHRDPARDAAGAVSGTVSGRPSFHTGEEASPWWQVDLGARRLVQQIRVYNRVDDRAIAARVNDLVIQGREDGGDWQDLYRGGAQTPFGGADGNPLIWTAPQPVVARTIKISVPRFTAFGLDQVEVFGPTQTRVSVVSFYMDNIPPAVVAAQRAIISKFLPRGFAFEQIKTEKSHSDSLDDYIRDTSSDVVVFLDIDCVPLHSNALLELSAYAAQGELVGCAQRASHIDNGGHLYVGPFCVALSRKVWDDIGRPSFATTSRGDVGEEITYRCEAQGIPLRFLWPSSVGDPVWQLTDGIRFGLNTEYGAGFFHAFTIREEANRRNFIAYCHALSKSPSHAPRWLDWSKPEGVAEPSSGAGNADPSPPRHHQEGTMTTTHAVLQQLQHDKQDLRLLKIAKEERCDIYNEASRGYHDFGNDWWVNDRSPYSFKYIAIDSLYPEIYFGKDTGHPSDLAAAQIYQYMQQVYQGIFGRSFQSVLELGTGGGEITREFHRHGLDYLAVEGTRFGVQSLLQAGIQESRISQQNLKFMAPVGRTFDLAMCTETAEHIEPFFASKIVDNCIRHAEAVWFSAADRNRPAHYHHINEQAIEAWDNLFAHMGFNFFVPLNGLHGRASRLYLSERLGEYLQLPSAARGMFRPD